MKLFFFLKKYIFDNRFIKICIFLLFVTVIYLQLTSKSDWDNIKESFYSSLTHINFFWLLLFLLLVPVNWTIEAIKWKRVINTQFKVGTTDSFKAIVAGLSLAIVTPNRIGDYAGRLIVIPAKYNWLSTVATFVSSISQNIVTIIFGIIGFYFLYNKLPGIVEFDLNPIFFLVMLTLVFGVYLCLNIDFLARFSGHLGLKKCVQRFRTPLILLRDLHRNRILEVLCYSILRFCIYSIQYYLMLRFFQIELSFLLSICSIWSIFLIQSGVPLPPFLSVLARGEIALVIWGLFDINELTILAVTFSIWLINLAVPAMLGLILIMNSNILSSLGYEKI